MSVFYDKFGENLANLSGENLTFQNVLERNSEIGIELKMWLEL